MYTIYLTTLLSLILNYLYQKKKNRSRKVILQNVCYFSATIASITFLFVILVSSNNRSFTEHKVEILDEKIYLKAMSDNFLLGTCRNKNTDFFYYYKYNDDGSICQEKQLVSRSVIFEVEDIERPYVETYSLVLDENSNMSKFLIDVESDYRTYKFYVPVNSVKSEYNLDLK